MEGNISLKDFILGVKAELLNASAEGSKSPYLELNNVELEAEFELDISGGVGGGLGIFVKAKVEGSAKQSHKVKLIFSPIKSPSGSGGVFQLNAPFYTLKPTTTFDSVADSLSGSANNPGPSSRPEWIEIKPEPQPPGVHFHGTNISTNQLSEFSEALKSEIDELFKKAMIESNQLFTVKKGGIPGPGKGGADM